MIPVGVYWYHLQWSLPVLENPLVVGGHLTNILEQQNREKNKLVNSRRFSKTFLNFSTTFSVAVAEGRAPQGLNFRRWEPIGWVRRMVTRRRWEGGKVDVGGGRKKEITSELQNYAEGGWGSRRVIGGTNFLSYLSLSLIFRDQILSQRLKSFLEVKVSLSLWEGRVVASTGDPPPPPASLCPNDPPSPSPSYNQTSASWSSN